MGMTNQEAIKRIEEHIAIHNLEVNRRHHGEMPNEVNHQMWKELKALPSVTPKLLNIDFLMPESELVFYDNDHGFCINTQDVLEHIRDICND